MRLALADDLRRLPEIGYAAGELSLHVPVKLNGEGLKWLALQHAPQIRFLLLRELKQEILKLVEEIVVDECNLVLPLRQFLVEVLVDYYD